MNLKIHINQKRRIITVLIFILLCLSANISAQNKINLSFKNTPLISVLKEITAQTGYEFIYSRDFKEMTESITTNFSSSNASMDIILKTILNGKNIAFEIINKKVMLAPKHIVPEQKGENKRNIIYGAVTDEIGETLPGVAIKNKTTNQVEISDINGKYQIEASLGEELFISSLGMQDASIKIIANKNVYNIILKQDLIALEDVVVTGYQTISKERSTGSYAVLSENALQSKIQSDIINKLEGMIPGLTTHKGDIAIRGKSTIFGNAKPLYILDGFPYEGDINAINSSDISNITILKDAAAASIYGARSANGVIILTTKKGIANKTTVEYNGNISVKYLQDERDYANLTDSKEFVNFQKEMFEIYHYPSTYLNNKIPINSVSNILYQHEKGEISADEMENKLNIFRNSENRDEYKLMKFMRKSNSTQQHNLSLRGGSEKYRYSASINYSRTDGYDKDDLNDRIGYNVRGNYNFYKWLKADFGLIGSYTRAEYLDGFSPLYMYSGISKYPSYQMIYDNTGNEISYYSNKSQVEIDRLKDTGLLDESYYPLKERNRVQQKTKNGYTNLNAGVTATILPELTIDFKYQLELNHGIQTYLQDKNAHQVRTMLNDATKIDFKTGNKTYLVPHGGIFTEKKSESNSYTLRGQINYNKIIKSKHDIAVIAGAENRELHNTYTSITKYGYDPISLSHKYIDEVLLSARQTGTQSINGSFTMWPSGQPKTFSDVLNRYVSFYANASYLYDNRYGISGSIRMDQSNLFGTDPKYQYRPLWSIGLSWHLKNEVFLRDINWVNKLTLRATKGINGNIAKYGGPFMVSQSKGVNNWTQDFQSQIITPPNSGLRWERTNQFNIGLDFAILDNRLSGTFEYYSKNTTDLLGDKQSDPSTGWDKLSINYADMYNKGYELSLNSLNIINPNFRWSTNFNLSYNKNQITNLEAADESVYSYVYGSNTRKDLPMGTLYSIRWAGLDEKGLPQAYKKDGSITKSFGDLKVDDLIESGTIIPPYAASLSNNISYKNLSLSFMFTMYAGNVMRDNMGQMITDTYAYQGISAKNPTRATANYWKSAEDSNNPDKSPAVLRNASSNTTNLWYGADKHILNAGYIKFREIILTYNLPQQTANKIGMSNLSISAQVQNIAVWGFNDKGLNPETWSGITFNSITPGTKNNPIYSLSLNVKF